MIQPTKKALKLMRLALAWSRANESTALGVKVTSSTHDPTHKIALKTGAFGNSVVSRK